MGLLTLGNLHLTSVVDNTTVASFINKLDQFLDCNTNLRYYPRLQQLAIKVRLGLPLRCRFTEGVAVGWVASDRSSSSDSSYHYLHAARVPVRG